MAEKNQVKSLFVLGGARSGKSRYAQAIAEASGRTPILIATAQAFDAEMRARIDRHKAERGSAWRTCEEPLALAEILRREAKLDAIVVVDCITLWLGNLLHAGREIRPAVQSLAETLPGLEGPVIFVSNEVGHGIVPDNALARSFRDIQGEANQALAAACAGVVFMTAGLPALLKPAPAPIISF